MENDRGLVRLLIMTDVVTQALVVVGIVLSMVNTMPMPAVMVDGMDEVVTRRTDLVSEARLAIEGAPVLLARTTICRLQDLGSLNMSRRWSQTELKVSDVQWLSVKSSWTDFSVVLSRTLFVGGVT